MTDWLSISQIEGLRPSDALAPSQMTPAAAAVNPYATPTAHPASTGNFNTDPAIEYGGIRRLAYFLRLLLLFVALIAVMAAGFAFSSGGEPSLIVIILVMLGFAVLAIRFAVQRVRNIGLNGWWVLLMFVPIVSNFFSIALLACPEGYADHKKMDTIGIVLAVIFVGLFLLSFILNIAGALA